MQEPDVYQPTEKQIDLFEKKIDKLLMQFQKAISDVFADQDEDVHEQIYKQVISQLTVLTMSFAEFVLFCSQVCPEYLSHANDTVVDSGQFRFSGPDERDRLKK